MSDTISAETTPTPTPTSALASGALAALPFDNRFVRELPADPQTDNYRREVTGALYSRVKPQPVAAPRTLAYAREVAALLDLTPADCETPAFAETFAGNLIQSGMDPYATVYGGHQFGNWAGQLGDGRAINLGEMINRHGERWALQLKGAGPTPYSRSADGLAVLRSSLREFLCSEAMHHLGVPTTRALSLVTTGEQVVRDMFYDGNARPEPGAVVCRIAPSFTRLGHFQLPAARGDHALLKQLVDYTIATDFADTPFAAIDDDQQRVAAWFREVCERTAKMIVGWMRVGFVHGVMNTDNLSVLGLTIDYGPYGWMDNFDPDWTPNTTDAGGRRYRYAHQPQIAMWNLAQFGNALVPLVGEPELLQAGLDAYAKAFGEGWRDAVTAKLGLRGFDAGRDDETLIDELLALLASVETDMTIFFRALADISDSDINPDGPEANALPAPLLDAYYVDNQLDAAYREKALAWLRRYAARVAVDGRPAAERREAMNAVNPRYVLRNYIAQLAIDDAEKGDASRLNDLLELMRRPYDEQPGQEEYAQKRPDWARERAGCSMLSCSS